MSRTYKHDERLENLNYQKVSLQAGDYENCIFVNCDFSSVDLSGINFLECEFNSCNLSLSILGKTTLKDTMFSSSKLLGLHFDDCNKMTISLAFESCNISLCSFNGLKLKKTVFNRSKIDESDFTFTDLSNCRFHDCDLERTIFHNTNLEGADFRTSRNFSIDPEQNRLKKAKFSLSGLEGLLEKYDLEIE